MARSKKKKMNLAMRFVKWLMSGWTIEAGSDKQSGEYVKANKKVKF